MSQISAFLFASFLCESSAPSTFGQGFTLEQVTSAPFSSELRAAPKGERLVWIANQQGHRNLFVAEQGKSGYTSHVLTHYDTDDGVDIGDIAWMPDGNSVVYARGADFEFPEKPSPNPALLAGGVTEEIWIAPVTGGEPHKLAEGRSPAVSPDSLALIFLNKGEVFSRPLRNLRENQRSCFTRAAALALLWSPDGHYVAFTSGRGDHGFVGIYSVASKSLLYLDPSTDTDDHPVWSADSRHIAFIRHQRDVPGGGFKPHRTVSTTGIWESPHSTPPTTRIATLLGSLSNRRPSPPSRRGARRFF